MDMAEANKPPTPEIDVAQQIANMIYEHEVESGGKFLLVDGKPSLFTGVDHRLLNIHHNDRAWNAHMLNIYCLNGKSRMTAYVTQFLESHATWFGERKEARRWVSFDQPNGVLFISNFDGHNWRLNGAGVEVTQDEHGRVTVSDDSWKSPGRDLDVNPHAEQVSIGVVNNGTGPIFADDDGGVPVPNPAVNRNHKLFKLIGGVSWAKQTGGGLTPRHQMQALIIWMFMVAFPEMFPTKPLLILEGAPGSGKSASLQLIQTILHGKNLPMVIDKNDQQNFKIQLLRNPIALLDNLDDFIDWMPNTIAAYATGAGWVTRELYTNAGEVSIKPQAFVVVASKNPVSFRQDDVADRSIMLRAERRRSFRPMRELVAQAKAQREETYGEWLYYLNRIVAVINSGVLPTHAEHRMADFETFAWAVSHALGWKSYIVPELMHALQRERVSFASENDIVVELLEQWLETPGNEMRMVTAKMLFKELEQMAEIDNKKFLKNPMSLAYRLRTQHVIEKFAIADHQQDQHGRKIYQIAKQLDAAGSMATN